VLGRVVASDRLLIASIGVGGKDNRILLCLVKAMVKLILVLCDVDTRRAAKTVNAFPS
jgi:hypothetical protein